MRESVAGSSNAAGSRTAFLRNNTTLNQTYLPVGTGNLGRLESLLSHVPVDVPAKEQVHALMGGTDRFYHGIDHLALLWDRHRRYCVEGRMDGPDVDTMIACAIAFHDAIYDSRQRDNEKRSAEFWMEASARSHISDLTRTWVADTIIATQDHLAYAPRVSRPFEEQPLFERARLWFLDLDLTPIGEDPAEFVRNTARLRAESPDRSDDAQERGRLRFLARLAAHPRIYRTPVLAGAFEAKARANLSRELG